MIYYTAAKVITYPTSTSITYANTSATTATDYIQSTWNTGAITTAATTWGYATTNSIVYLSQQQWIQWNGAFVSQATQKRSAAEEAAETARLRKLYEDEARAKVQAAERAKALLQTHLTLAQRKSLADLGYFEINVSGKVYRIRQGTHGNVRLMHNGRERTSFCAQPGGVPVEDAMLAQKLMLETDEAEFLRIANPRQLVTAQELFEEPMAAALARAA